MQMLSVQFLPFMVAVIFHEFAHGFVAHRWGDNTAKDAGRMTLNPLPHIDPVGTLAFPIICMLSGVSVLFGWARPVPINPNRFRRYKPGLFWVSLAGPGMNFTLAILSAAFTCALLKWMDPTSYVYEPLQAMSVVSIQLNFMLGLFNLIPVPPLDGSKIVEVFLPLRAARKFEAFSRYAAMALMLVLFTGAASYVFQPLVAATQALTDLALGAFILLFKLKA